MTQPKVYVVHLRRPDRSKPRERRADPFFEFGSFGCTGCHSSTLFHPRHADSLQGSRLAFVQGGPFGHRLVLLTPPIAVTVGSDRCEARWKPSKMPFKYDEAPVVAWNHGKSDFPMIERFVRKTRRNTIEGALSSRFRSTVQPLPTDMAKELIAVYEQKRKKKNRSAIATTYEEALPWPPPKIDDKEKREITLQKLRSRLTGDPKRRPVESGIRDDGSAVFRLNVGCRADCGAVERAGPNSIPAHVARWSGRQENNNLRKKNPQTRSGESCGLTMTAGAAGASVLP